jgi:hypothetical protein
MELSNFYCNYQIINKKLYFLMNGIYHAVFDFKIKQVTAERASRNRIICGY